MIPSAPASAPEARTRPMASSTLPISGRSGHGLERAEIAAHLGEAARARHARVLGQGAVRQVEDDARAERRHAPALALGDLAELGQADVAQPVDAAPNGMPRLAESDGAAERGIARAADPDGGAGGPHGPRRGVDVAEAHEAPLVTRDALRPACLDRLEIVVGQRAALLEGHTDGLELLLRP